MNCFKVMSSNMCQMSLLGTGGWSRVEQPGWDCPQVLSKCGVDRHPISKNGDSFSVTIQAERFGTGTTLG